MVILIVAYNNNFAIAENGKIPWHLPEDLKHFKETTLNGTVIMGRTTFETLPKPLPNRLNIVLTRNIDETSKKHNFEGVYFTNSLSMAFKKSLTINPNRNIYIIGGEQIYNMALKENYVQRVIASEVKNDASGDRFFPNLKEQGWMPQVEKSYDGFKVVDYVPLEPTRQICLIKV